LRGVPRSVRRAAGVSRVLAWVVLAIGMGHAGSAVRAAPPAPVVGGVGTSAGVGTAVAADTPASPDVAQADADLERGLALLRAKKGSNRLAQADAAFSAAIARLTPVEETLEAGGRLVLARALDGRAQTNLLRGRTKAADADFERLVGFEPAYEPDPADTPRKALERFRKIRAPRVGFLTLKIDPPEAGIELNGRSLGAASALPAERAVLAGPYTVRARRDCYEDKESSGSLAAGEKKDVVLALDPFARMVRFETSPAGFDVDIDGTLAGRTEARPAAEGSPPDADATGDHGVLELACLPAGDHAYTVRRECYAEVRGKLGVEIDLLDKTPILVPLITPKKRETRLSVTSDTPGTDLYLDGKPLGPLPLRDQKLCLARATLEARVKERAIWSQTRDLEDGPLELAVRRRPTLTVITSVVGGVLPDAAVAERIHGRVASLQAVSVVDPPTTLDDGKGTPGASPGARPLPDLQLEISAGAVEPGKPSITLHFAPLALPHQAIDVVCRKEDAACLDRFFDALDAAWSPASGSSPDTLTAPLPRVIAVTRLDAAVLPSGPERNASLMTLAGALIGAGAYREALDQSLDQPGWAGNVPGPASAATAAFLSGICHQALGEAPQSRAAFQRAQLDPKATLWTPAGPPVAALARLLLAEHSPK